MEFDPVTQGLVGAMGALWTRVAVFIPNLIGALVLVLLGGARTPPALLERLRDEPHHPRRLGQREQVGQREVAHVLAEQLDRA